MLLRFGFAALNLGWSFFQHNYYKGNVKMAFYPKSLFHDSQEDTMTTDGPMYTGKIIEVRNLFFSVVRGWRQKTPPRREPFTFTGL